MAITDKMVKNGRLSVKCVLLTDKSSKMDALSVILNEILAEWLSSIVLKRWFFICGKLKKRLAKSIKNRLPSFDISFNSIKKRDFFPSLFVGTNQATDFVKNDTQF